MGVLQFTVFVAGAPSKPLFSGVVSMSNSDKKPKSNSKNNAVFLVSGMKLGCSRLIQGGLWGILPLRKGPENPHPRAHFMGPFNAQSRGFMFSFRWFLVFAFLIVGCREETTPDGTPPVADNNTAAPKTESETSPTSTPEPPKAWNFASQPQFSGTRIGVLHAGNVMGELDDCGCNIKPLGGLARKVQWVNQHRDQWTDLLLLDAGDLFTNKAKLSSEEKDIALSRADTYIRAYQNASYDAIAIGDRDLSLGVDALLSLQKKAAFPFLNANLKNKANGTAVFQERLLLEKGGTKIGVFGLMPSKALGPLEESAEEWTIEDPIAAAKTQTAALKTEGAEIIIALAHLSESTQEKLADRVDGLTFILGGQSVSEPGHPTRLGQSYLVGGHEKGKHLSGLTLFVKEGDLTFADPTAKSQLTSTITKLEKRVASRTTAIQEAEATDQTGNLDWLKKDLVKARTELQMAKMDLGEFDEESDQGSFIAFDLIDIHSALPDHPETSALVQSLKEKHPSLEKK